MTETSTNSTESKLVLDSNTALLMAHAEKPYRELEIHAKELGLGHIAVDMARHATEASDAVIATEIQDFHDEYEDETEETLENKELTTEQISELIRESAFVGGAWMIGRKINRDNIDTPTESGFVTVHNRGGRVKQYSETRTSDQLKKEYNDEAISDLVTVTELQQPFGKCNPESQKASEPIVVVSYETVTRVSGQRKFIYTDGIGRPGNEFYFHMCLPASSADILVEAIKEDPAIIRTVGDVLMRDEVGAEELWDEARPPYEQWSEASDGKNCLALRRSVSEVPAKSEKLEFRD